MRFENPKNHLYHLLAPAFLMKKLTLQELFLQKRTLPRFDRVRITDWETLWRQLNFGTYVGTAAICLYQIANSTMMPRHGPSGTIARLGILAVSLNVLSDVAKVSYFYDSNRAYVDGLVDHSGIEVYNPYQPE